MILKNTTKTPASYEMLLLKCRIFQLLWCNPGKATVSLIVRIINLLAFVYILRVLLHFLKWWLKHEGSI